MVLWFLGFSYITGFFEFFFDGFLWVFLGFLFLLSFVPFFFME